MIKPATIYQVNSGKYNTVAEHIRYYTEQYLKLIKVDFKTKTRRTK